MDYHDEELPAGFQEADFLQRSMEEQSRQASRLHRGGICTHGSAIGYVSPPCYNVQESMSPGEAICTDGCGLIFDDEVIHSAWPVALIWPNTRGDLRNYTPDEGRDSLKVLWIGN